MASRPLLEWRCCAFDALSVQELQGIHRVRQEVFVLEQRSLYVDADAFDEAARHLAAWSPGQLLPRAYARVLPPGTRYAEPAIGRVLTHAAARGQGLGRLLMQRALAEAAACHAGWRVRISAQSHLVGFYGSMGFEPVGEPYEEDGIAHVEMLLRHALA